jgi:3-hydroxybutyryl-CoA dehydrogenase
MTDTSPTIDAIDRVAIIGAGTIGASWAALFLARGLSVEVFDPAPDAERTVRDYVTTAWPSLERLGLADRGDPARLGFHGDAASAAKGVQLVQENVPERVDIKHATYRLIEAVLPPEAIIATSTSGILLSDLQTALARPERLVLAHPFNPPHLIPLVELLGNERTAPAAVDGCEAFYESCGKVTIRVRKEVPGHVANRLQAALWREAVNLVLEDVASVADIDKAITHGPGLRWAVMGPHMLFSLAAGGGGMQAFCEHLGPPINGWFDTLGTPKITPAVGETLAQGVAAAEAGRSFAELTAERDEKLIRILAALDASRRP